MCTSDAGPEQSLFLLILFLEQLFLIFNEMLSIGSLGSREIVCRTHVSVLQPKNTVHKISTLTRNVFHLMPLFQQFVALKHNNEWSDSTRKARELLGLTSEHSRTVWHQQGELTLLSHMVENLVC